MTPAGHGLSDELLEHGADAPADQVRALVRWQVMETFEPKREAHR
jgi:hypothetical protein